ncbi:hypothetical protein [Arthrobacter globiformis]|nr:hypothetical protein [Arthrobacter globiformis]MDQ0864731.1 hypothetical protein [Arthrobacter globiformis]
MSFSGTRFNGFSGYVGIHREFVLGRTDPAALNSIPTTVIG